MSLYTQRNSLPLWCFTWKKYELIEAWYEHYRDDFDDGVLDFEWTTHGLGANRAITEVGNVLTMDITNNVDARWWWNFPNNAPKMYVPLGVLAPCRITTKINSMDGDPAGTINDCTGAGIFISTWPEGESGTSRLVYKWQRYKYNNGAYDGIRLRANDASWAEQAGVVSPVFPLWFRLNITADGNIHFEYSTDGAAWSEYDHLIVSGWNIADSFVGIFTENRTGTFCTPFGNASCEFEYFLIEVYEARSPTEEECYAPIDTRSKTSSVFYDGYVKSMSNLKRAVDDKTGLFQITDLNLTLQNANKYFSSKLTNRILKNQEVIMYHAWTDEPEANKSHVITLIVEDHSIKGPDFLVKLKDISQRYFTKKIPEHICTSGDYPNIHADHEGRCKPEILGNATLSGGHEHEGAVEAVYVDTTTGRFIAANRPLHDITGVWLDDVLQADPAQYSWLVADGDTYIDFVAAPTDETVTFNAEGYSRGAWDSTRGYIENPAYIILFYLRFIMGIPASLIDIPAFTALAGYYEDVGEDESCYLILQDRQDAMEVLRQLLFTAGAKGWINMDGEFTAERKDVDDWEIASIDYHIFEQTDLIGSPHRKWNLTAAINTINAQFGYIPWLRLYAGARYEYRDNRYAEENEIMEDDIQDADRVVR